MTALHVTIIVLEILSVVFTLAWVASLRLHDASIVDICWGPGFALAGWLYFAQQHGFDRRPLIMAALVTFWGLRLGGHIFFRHRGQAEDRRYGSIRKAHGSAFWWKSLFVVFWLQAALIWFISLPFFVESRAAGPGHVTITDIAGGLLFVVGFAFEVIGDNQLRRFKASPANRGKVLDRGVWRYTRHPNYFGDAVLWWGLYLIAASTAGGWLTILSPALMTFLLTRVSGVTLLEKNMQASKPDYAAYVARTSSFFPWLPRSAQR